MTTFKVITVTAKEPSRKEFPQRDVRRIIKSGEMRTKKTVLDSDLNNNYRQKDSTFRMWVFNAKLSLREFCMQYNNW